VLRACCSPVPLIQPRLDSIEEWTYINNNNDGHPIHVHVNDFQVSEIVDPVAGVTTGFQGWGQDNANLPVPVSDADQTVTEASRLSIRSKFVEYTGAFVSHCHRLNHEDNGMMLVVSVGRE
jgi:FtsP/CotA-like multicopper oxidase with cupredoxin domain